MVVFDGLLSLLIVTIIIKVLLLTEFLYRVTVSFITIFSSFIGIRLENIIFAQRVKYLTLVFTQQYGLSVGVKTPTFE